MYRTLWLSLCAAVMITGCATQTNRGERTVGVVNLTDAHGQSAGQARIVEGHGGLIIQLSAQRIAPGTHGVHLHMVGNCTAAGFISAGAHLNPTGHQHGLANPAGSHLGDMPNLVVESDGNGSFAAPLTGNAANLEAVLFDADGTALVIHAAADDNRTDPSGNSGPRIACGVLEPA